MTIIEIDRSAVLENFLRWANNQPDSSYVYLEVLDTTRDLLAWRDVEEENPS